MLNFFLKGAAYKKKHELMAAFKKRFINVCYCVILSLLFIRQK